METAPTTSTEPAHPVASEPHEVAHNEEFYATSNPKYLGLPLGVLIAAAVSATAVCITLLKFLGASL
jgi:hypothetical protein